MTTISSILVAVTTGALAIAEAGAAQQFDVSAPSATPVPGFASVDIGGRSLRYKCFGAGTPTVLIEPGGGVSLETVFSWDKPIGRVRRQTARHPRAEPELERSLCARRRRAVDR
jgi:hypothetical protein